MKPLRTTLFFMLISELKYPLNLKVKLFASWLCSTGTTSWHTAAFNVFLRLTGDLRRVHSSSTESSFPLLSLVFICRCLLLWNVSPPLHSGRFPTLCPVTVFADINHTNRQHLEIPNDKQQMTCPFQTKHSSWVSVKHWCLPSAPEGSAGTVWPCHAAPLREWSVQTQDTVDELVDMRTSHSTLCVKICASYQALAVNWSFLRSRRRRSSMLETSSSLEEISKHLWVPIMPQFYPPIQTALRVIHACTWQNTLSF